MSGQSTSIIELSKATVLKIEAWPGLLFMITKSVPAMSGIRKSVPIWKGLM
jgi:hypothetical protein